jgi:glycosyltransferase involved in cell wall biosynthesis
MLSEAVDSVVAQSFENWELVVVDDASEPPVELRVPARFTGKVRCVRHAESQGGSAAKNSGIAAGRGEIFAFLDDDDLYDPHYLERAVAVLDRHPDIDVLLMGVHWFGAAAEWGERTQAESMAKLLADAKPRGLGGNVSAFGEAFLPALLKRVPMPMQRPVVRRGAMDRIGAYRADCLLWDCEWVLRASMVARCAYLDEPLYHQRLDGQGTSSRGDRELDHLKSGFDMTWRLYSSPPFPISDRFREFLRRAASDAALGIARHQALRGEAMPALRAWSLSQSTRPALSGLRSLAAITRTLLLRSRSAPAPRSR